MLEANGWLQLRLLGSCEIKDSEGEIRFESNKTRALLIYLVMNPGTHQRDKLIDLFWGDFPEANARRNLRHALWNIRQKINPSDTPPNLVADPQTVAISPEADVWIDVVAFQDSVYHFSDDPDESALSALSTAIESYRGDFLDGFHVRNAAVFEEWALVERERLRTLAMDTLQQLLERYSEQGELDIALIFARRLLALTPWREDTHRQIMRLLDAAGQPDAALTQYEICRRVLAEELNITPSQETTHLYTRIKSKREQDRDDNHALSLNRSPLPLPSTPFVGREDEKAEISALLDDPNSRLVTLTGPGGMGKTRLALQVATQKTSAFAHGIFFVPLANQRTAPELISKLISAIGFTPFVQPDPKTQLHNYLREREILLILDNFEHLVDSSTELAEILQACAGVKIIVTSRQRLNLQAEWVYPLEGLTDENAIALFTQSARRVKLGFKLTTDEKRNIIRISRAVFGLPLAIEIAAAWVYSLPCDAIAQQVEMHLSGGESASLDFLTSQWRDIPERHRSLRAVFDYSWDLLSEVEKDVFMKLSFFHGGFRRDAAEQIAGTSLKTLLALVDKSLLQHNPNGRYELHGLSREYAAARLQQDQPLQKVMKVVYLAYYADYIQTHEITERANLVWLEEEIENIRAAWRWAIEAKQEEVIEKLFRGLYVFYEVRSAFQQGEELFDDAIDDMEWSSLLDDDDISPTSTKLLPWQLAAARAAFTCRLGRFAEALQVLERSLAGFRHHADHKDMAFSLFYLGDISRLMGDHTKAREYLQESLSLHREIGDRGGVGFCLNVLGVIASTLQEFDQARELLEQSRNIFLDIGHQWGLAVVSINYGSLLKALQEYSLARQYLEESLTLCQKLNHRWAMAACFTHLGSIFYLQGETTQALKYYQDALRFQKEIGDRRGMLVILMEIASIMAEQDQTEWGVEIFTVIQHHAAGFADLQEQADHRLTDLASQVPDDVFQKAQKKGLDRGLDIVVEDILSTGI